MAYPDHPNSWRVWTTLMLDIQLWPTPSLLCLTFFIFPFYMWKKDSPFWHPHLSHFMLNSWMETWTNLPFFITNFKMKKMSLFSFFFLLAKVKKKSPSIFFFLYIYILCHSGPSRVCALIWWRELDMWQQIGLDQMGLVQMRAD